ncbi:MAG: 2-oxoglutarate dehydrogenase, E2 component, dihydrolipoamide succinyltransferase [Calditrichia bacterium]
MKVDVTMPKLGESLTEGTILKWLKSVGDTVEKDEILLEVSTDKVDSEIPSPVSGTLVEILAQENETVEVESVIARMETGAKQGSAVEKTVQKEENGKTGSVQQPAREKVQEAFETSETAESSANLMDITMPKLGESLTEGTILKWWKGAGDSVHKDETLLEVSTDKVDSEIPSPADGILQEVLVQENETVEIGAVLCRLEIKGEKPRTAQPAPQTVSRPEEEPGASETSIKKEPVPAGEEKSGGAGLPEDGRFYSPLVRTIARKENLSRQELAQIPGSGANGRVTKNDVLNYLEQRGRRTARPEEARPAPETRPRAKAPAPVNYNDQGVHITEMDAVRKRIATHMRKSLETSAHVYSVSECDMTAVMNLMRAKRPEFLQQNGFKLTVTPFILQAVSRAIQDFPLINSSVDGEKIFQHRDINLGIAVASEKGLIVPVIKNTADKSLQGLAKASHDLVQRTRSNKLTVEDVQGATFTITNYGIFGNIIGLPIINQPNVAILGVGAIKKRPVVIEHEAGDSIAIRSMTYISMSYDHRLIDGELGGRFMQRLVEYLENISEESL